jgi:hypothetical protein
MPMDHARRGSPEAPAGGARAIGAALTDLCAGARGRPLQSDRGIRVMLAAGLRLWRLDQDGFGNAYSAAAVRSVLQGGTNFFFGSFDPVGFVTADKPPVAL